MKNSLAIQDIILTFENHYIVWALGWQDVATRYRRSRVGAFWLTINMMVMLVSLGLVFGTLFDQPLGSFFPYLAIGLIFWNYLATLMNEGCTSFTQVADTILQVRMPLFVHVLRVMWRNTIILAHNLMILPFVLIICEHSVNVYMIYMIPGFLLFILNSTWIMLVSAVICTRFRDMTQIIQNGIQVMFYVTPIMWSASMLPKRFDAQWLHFNPLYHFIELVRAPLMGTLPQAIHWWVAIGIAGVGWGMALGLYHRYYKRLAYWL